MIDVDEDNKIKLIFIVDEYLEELKASLKTCDALLMLNECFMNNAQREEIKLKASKINNKIHYIERVLLEQRIQPTPSRERKISYIWQLLADVLNEDNPNPYLR